MAETRDDYRECYSLSRKKVSRVFLPEVKNRQCYPTEGWICTVNINAKEMNLLHPFSRISIQLPLRKELGALAEKRFPSRERREWYHSISRAVLSASPSVTSDYVLAVYYSANFDHLACWRPGDLNWTYVDFDHCGESEVGYISMDKDHFSIFELLYYTKEFGYVTVGGLYCKDPIKKVFIKVENDLTLVSLVEDLKYGDFLDLYVNHVVDKLEVVEDGVPSAFLCGPVGDQSSNVVGENSNVGEYISTFHDINFEGLHEKPTQTDNIDVEFGADELSYLEEAETDLDSSANSQEFNIPEDDDFEIDKELRTFRNERRSYVEKKETCPK
ncbi:hypothetical protein CQW23_22014 [Capsicum baccatum]|uniref:KIB1-4 beta-propeller domain-containing protein n=1 Tax=Capsicum baccatum TaxID=33114 RepID=A0A2G2VZP9_CAPBA|nr:hypothetical protein CQW23_22014 [Capsicum baccatum]